MSAVRTDRARRDALRSALEACLDESVLSILHRDFWRAPAKSPLRLVFTSQR